MLFTGDRVTVSRPPVSRSLKPLSTGLPLTGDLSPVMPQKPRTNRRQASRDTAPSLKSRTDSARYGSEWRKLRGLLLYCKPTCTCGRVRVWDQAAKSYLVQDFSEYPGQIAPAVLVDHVRPLSMGGDDRVSNLQSLCRQCHAKKTKRWG